MDNYVVSLAIQLEQPRDEGSQPSQEARPPAYLHRTSIVAQKHHTAKLGVTHTAQRTVTHPGIPGAFPGALPGRHYEVSAVQHLVPRPTAFGG